MNVSDRYFVLKSIFFYIFYGQMEFFLHSFRFSKAFVLYFMLVSDVYWFCSDLEFSVIWAFVYVYCKLYALLCKLCTLFSKQWFFPLSCVFKELIFRTIMALSQNRHLRDGYVLLLLSLGESSVLITICLFLLRN